MPANHAIQRITLLSFRTFGDYVLKAPFLFELGRRYPHAEITLLTNRKGGQVYPLLDSDVYKRQGNGSRCCRLAHHYDQELRLAAGARKERDLRADQ